MLLFLNNAKPMHVHNSQDYRYDMVLPPYKVSVVGLHHSADNRHDIKAYFVMVEINDDTGNIPSIEFHYHINGKKEFEEAKEKLRDVTDDVVIYFVEKTFSFFNSTNLLRLMMELYEIAYKDGVKTTRRNLAGILKNLMDEDSADDLSEPDWEDC